MRRFKKQSLNRKDYRLEEVTASICRVLLTPIMVFYAIYIWTWDTVINQFNKD